MPEDQNKSPQQSSQKKDAKVQTVQNVEEKAAEDNATGFVEEDAPEPDNKVRAVSTPNPLYKGAMQGAPEDDYAGVDLLIAAQQEVVDPLADSYRQQAEQYPRLSDDFFHPESHHDEYPVEEVKAGRSSVSRANVGRYVVVDYPCVIDGEVVGAGVQDLPLDLADKLIGAGMAFEPAGKKAGR